MHQSKFELDCNCVFYPCFYPSAQEASPYKLSRCQEQQPATVLLYYVLLFGMKAQCSSRLLIPIATH